MPTVFRSAAAVLAAGIWCAASPAADPPRPTTLTPQEVADGWVNLFDGGTTFGWKVDGEAVVKDGKLAIGGTKPTRLATRVAFGPARLRYQFSAPDEENAKGGALVTSGYTLSFAGEVGMKGAKNIGDDGAKPIVIEVPAGQQIVFSELKLLPARLRPLFNGKDLSGWKVFDADPNRAKAKFEVTKDGELHATGGPGDLQSEATFADFVLQARAKTAGQTVNSGVFFRCIPGDYQNGYEAQIQNAYKDNDRTKPTDAGTGAIYRRVPARKVVAGDGEWFTLTLVAHGNHFATWVNGYQTVDWTDDRKPDDNPRKGLRTAAGPLSIQGHGPPTTADVLFKSIQIAELK